METNLLDEDGGLERTWPPERPGFSWRRKRVGGEHLGASLYELPPGQSTFPYHYELGNDELLVVVSGGPTLRSPEGKRDLSPGDYLLFPSGPAGAHQLTNRSGEPARVLLVSNLALPCGAVQVDSDKLMVRWGTGPDDRLWFRRGDAIDYWDGEESAGSGVPG
jgi:uncharacterized cupin superfamily protein